MLMQIRRPMAMLILLSFIGCVRIPSLTEEEKQTLPQHYILVDRDGFALDRKGNALSTEGLQQDLTDTILAGLKTRAKQLHEENEQSKCQILTDCPPMRVLVFVHGGMNGYKADFKRIRGLVERDPGEMKPAILHAAHSTYYPIFINWNSDLPDSIKDDLFFIRAGEREADWYTALTWPFLLIGRLAGSVASLPVSMGHTGRNIKEGFKGAIEQGDSKACAVADVIAHSPLFLINAATTPLLEGFGRPGWHIMKRRAELSIASRLEKNDHRSMEGAVRTLIKTIRQPILQLTVDHQIAVEITLVGHSMGSLILNRLLAVLEQQGGLIPIQHIIYLAPAASIEELDEMVFPFLVSHRETKFWLFTLNRRDEAREIPQPLAILLPRGSLLAWIDTFLEPVGAVGDKTLGSIRNVNNYYQPEPLPFTPQREVFRERTINWNHNAAGQIRVFETVRDLNQKNRIEEHSDFSAPRFLGQVLCKIDHEAFKNKLCENELNQFYPQYDPEKDRQTRICGARVWPWP
ncbi:MAG: hypothetical protein ACREJU_10680 [Nitrospiraceae bacterium]